MAKRSDLKLYRLRRTLTRAAASKPGQLRRALWGISAAQVRRTIAEQEQRFRSRLSQAEAALTAERSDTQRLRSEIIRQKGRLETLRNVVEVLRGKLVRERAARAVLSARLAADSEVAAGNQGDARLESVRLSADLRQEFESLRQLVAVLYRTVAGRDGVPAGLDVVPDPPAPRLRVGQGVENAPPHWYKVIVGKEMSRSLRDRDGRLIISEGAGVTAGHIQQAEQAGLLFDLILNLRIPQLDQEL